MKRAAVFAMGVVVIASAWSYLAAQSAPTSASDVFKAPGQTAPPHTSIDLTPNATVSIEAPKNTAPMTPLQQHYMDLTAQKVRLMTEEQLQKAANAIDREVQELKAWSKIDETARQLREVIDKNPQTQAAEAARAALEAIEQSRRPRHGFEAGKRYARDKLGPVRASPFGAEAKPPADPRT